MLIASLLFAGAMFAQEIEPEFTKTGDLVKGTYFFDNGEIQQEGTYKNGELHGEWIAYNTEGEKIAVGKYENGEKTGKWFFWNGDKLMEVDYSNNRITHVTGWKNGQTLVSN